jgi:FemAB-related protein (PEP-CTERM system-associated)
MLNDLCAEDRAERFGGKGELSEVGLYIGACASMGGNGQAGIAIVTADGAPTEGSKLGNEIPSSTSGIEHLVFCSDRRQAPEPELVEMPLLTDGIAIRQNIILTAFRQIINGSLHSADIVIISLIRCKGGMATASLRLSRRYAAEFRVDCGAWGVSKGTTMDVVLLTPDSEKDWQRFVEDLPQASLAHALGWRNVVEKTYRHVPVYLMAIDRQTVAGVLPLFLIRSPFFGRLLATAPYLSYGGLLADDRKAAQALVQAARTMASEYRAKSVELRGLSRLDYGLLLKEKYCTFRLCLSMGPEALWRQFEGGRARTAIRKALKAGLVVEEGPQLSAIFADVMSRHMRDLGTPFHRMRFYQHIIDEFPQQSEILMARQGDHYIGGILLVSYKETVYWLYGAGLMEFRSLAPISLLVWEAIRSACERGFTYFDFGRSRWESGTFFFKRQWGAQPIPLFYEYHLAKGGRVPDMDPANPSFRWAIALWNRLPLFAAKALGPLIVRDIP